MLDDKLKENLREMSKSVRALSIDAVQAANSGHPGLPLGCADLGTLLYTNILKHNPKNPNWINRDRFILSAGHGSMLLYSLLHLTGYNLSLDDIKNFRQLGSKTPGHPEYGHTEGVETTTGPLGAGFSNAVGMAIAESHLAEKFNTDEFKIIDNYIFALAGDGCLMEGISSEAASLAGHLGLGKLIIFYDSNRISIEGSTDIAFTENVETRFKAYGWQILEGSAYNYDEIQTLVNIAKADKSRPALITLNSIIGYGSPNKQGSHEAHGSPLGADEVAETKQTLNIPVEDFYISPAVKPFIEEKQHDWEIEQKNWEINFAKWAEINPELKKEWDLFFSDIKTDQIEFPSYDIGDEEATRNSGGKCINAIADVLPNLLGGSADLAPSTKTIMKDKGDYDKANRLGRNMHFGVREHAMGGITNGMLLYGGLKTYTATFLVFSDYMRPAIRLSALMKIPQIYVFTHDSIFVGEDGPTHQPIEHAEALRIIPNLNVLRPGDGEETVEAWKMALESRDTPTALLLTRQNVPVYTKEDPHWKENIRKGAYIVKESDDHPELVVLASGSEVSLVDEAIKLSGRKIQLISVLSRELFEKNIDELSNLIPEGVKVIAIEAGVTSGWKAFADEVIGIDRFGECGPGAKVADFFGLTAQKIADKLNEL